MTELYQVLTECPLFEGITPQEMKAMLMCLGAKEVRAQKSQVIFAEGAPALYVGIVLKGAVRLIREDYYGNRSIVAHISPGEVFGETYACAGLQSLPISIVAEEESVCLLIDCRRITVSCTNACAFHSRMIFNLLRLVAAKNLLFHQKIEITSKRSTREKLMTYLMNQAKLCGKDEFAIPYDRQSLADYLEVERSGLSSEISKLRREGKIVCDKNVFRLIRS